MPTKLSQPTSTRCSLPVGNCQGALPALDASYDHGIQWRGALSACTENSPGSGSYGHTSRCDPAANYAEV